MSVCWKNLIIGAERKPEVPPLTSQPSEKNTIQLNNALKDATLIKMS